MSIFQKLIIDIGKLLSKYGTAYLNGIANTLILALSATLIGCVIGFLCGILQTIPYQKTDHVIKRFFLKLIRVIIRVYVEVFRGTPMVLQAVFIYYGLPYFTNSALRFSSFRSIPAPIWRNPCAAVLFRSIPARQKAQRRSV